MRIKRKTLKGGGLKMRKGILLLFALLLLFYSGCAESIRYTEDEIKSFPAEIQDNIRKGEVGLGMTTEQVRYAWGSPDSIKFLDPFEGKPREEWTYSSTGTMGIISSKILLFFDGRLIYIKY
jgi:outer membrane protein assembly factor BamE (lipoprotein component of BamABCDE complex)